MANKAKIGASIVLDGEKKYKEAVTGCNNKLKELRAELGLVKEKYVEKAIHKDYIYINRYKQER